MTHAISATTLLVAAALLAPPAPAAARTDTPQPLADFDACDQLSDLTTREACYARLPPAVIEECESLRRFACAPYRDMYLAEQEHDVAARALIEASTRIYGDVGSGDGAFVTDLVHHLRAADAAWAAWRDAECALEPILDGMSRGEAGRLTEACRAERTRRRAAELRDRATRMEDAR